ncbi:YbaB/EbfC family nucleoid-associated protein [Kitasatospora herbaricolor]|uniref:YbaB/EbfC family nucleoid-associated protein n=1 Tax=Kitasatospora herbaricolor TaxID=68217 RepID=UPI0036D93229
MDSFSEFDVDKLRQQFNDRMAEFSSLHQRMREISASATSAKRLLTVTVGAQGEVTALKFHSDGYRSMARPELEHLILDTIGRARSQVMDSLKSMVAPLAPEGVNIDDVMEGRFEPVDFLSGDGFPKQSGPARAGGYDDEEE